MIEAEHAQEEFEAAYRAKFPYIVFGVDMVSMPCTCEDGGGPTHWAAIRNSPEAIAEHLQNEECLKQIREYEKGDAT